MSRQGNFPALHETSLWLPLLYALICAFVLPLAHADESSSRCFELSSSSAKISKPLKEPIELKTGGPGAVAEKSGKLKGDTLWGAARGELAVPLEEVLRLLRDPNTTKSSKVSELEVTEIPNPNYLALQRIKFVTKPFPLVTIDWTVDYGFALLEGTAQEPKRVLVSYQKSEGTSHIEHLCGSMLLQKKGEGLTDVYLYEEARATGRSLEDTVNGLKATLKDLSQKAQKKAQENQKTANVQSTSSTRNTKN